MATPQQSRSSRAKPTKVRGQEPAAKTNRVMVRLNDFDLADLTTALELAKAERPQEIVAAAPLLREHAFKGIRAYISQRGGQLAGAA